MTGLCHYIIVRRDLPVGTIFAQITHAAGESFYAYACRGSSEKEQRCDSPQVGGSSPSPGSIPIDRTKAVVFGCRNETRLLKLEQALKDCGFRFVAIREPDAPHHGALMAIGLEPVVRHALLDSILNEFHIFRQVDTDAVEV